MKVLIILESCASCAEHGLKVIFSIYGPFTKKYHFLHKVEFINSHHNKVATNKLNLDLLCVDRIISTHK